MFDWLWALSGWVRYQAVFGQGYSRLTLVRWGKSGDHGAANEFYQLVNSLENDGWVQIREVNG